MKRAAKLGTAAVLLLGIAVGTVWTLQQKGEASPDQEPRRVGPKLILARGRTEPIGRVHTVAAPTRGGTVAELRVKEGDKVEQGQILAVLGTFAYRNAAVETASRGLIVARMELARTLSDAEQARLDGLATVVAMKEAEAARAERVFTRSQSLARANVVSEDQRDLRELERRQSQEGLNKARFDLRQMVEQRRMDAEVGRARIAQAVAELTRTTIDRDDDVVRAPISGTVLNVMARTGETINADGLLTLADTTETIVIAEVDELDAARLVPGQRATIEGQLWPGGTLGRVTRVAQRVFRSERPSTDVLAGRDARIVEAEIKLDSPERLPQIFGLEVKVSFEVTPPK